jgi:hypothetical protein
MNPLVSLVGTLAGPVIERFFPDKTKAQEFAQQLQLRLLDSDVQQAVAQLEVNKVEAGSADPFVSRWRPFIGWVCGSAFAWNFVLNPAVVTISALLGNPIVIAPLDMGEMMPVLIGMLGLGGMRTFEKVQGATK